MVKTKSKVVFPIKNVVFLLVTLKDSVKMKKKCEKCFNEKKTEFVLHNWSKEELLRPINHKFSFCRKNSCNGLCKANICEAGSRLEISQGKY